MGSHFLNLKAGEFSSGWRSEQNTLVRNFRPGLENLTNVFPTGSSLKTRDSTKKTIDNLPVWKSKITTIGVSGPRYLRMVPFKFSQFPDSDFKDYGWQPFSVMFIFTLKERASVFYLDWTVYVEGEKSEYTDFNLYPRHGEFSDKEFNLGSESDLSAWRIVHNDQFLYILTDRGQFKKLSVKLIDDPDRTDSPPATGERKFLGRSKLEFEFINQKEANREKGPSLNAIYWPTKFQDIPFNKNEDYARDDDTSFYDRTTATQRTQIDSGDENGTWWAVQPFGNHSDIPGRVISRPKNMSIHPMSQDIQYTCTYVDKNGVETDPGDLFSVYELNYSRGRSYLADEAIDEEGSAFYGDTFPEGQIDVTLPNGRNLSITGRPQNTPLADLATARIRPNRINDYDGYFNFKNPTNRLTSDVPPIRLTYPKHFRGGHHKILPGTQWQYALTEDSNSQSRTMIWHLVLDPNSLKDGFRWILVYKKIINPYTSPESAPFELMQVLPITDDVTNLPGQRGNSLWKSDGSSNRYPYTLKDAGTPTGSSITIGTRFYTLGEGNPRVLSFYNQRLFLGNFDGFPMLIRASEIGKEDFKRRSPTAPDDAFDFRPSSNDGRVLKFMVSLKDLILFTDEGTHVIRDGSGVSAGAISVPQRNPYGIGELHPLVVRDTVLFFEKDGKSLRDYKYNWNINNFRGDDLMIFARHLVSENNIVSWAFENHDVPIVWAIREDGSVLSMTYIPELEMFSWAKHKLPNGAKAKSVETMFNRKNITDIPQTRRVKTGWSVLFHVETFRGSDEIWTMVRDDESYNKLGLDTATEGVVTPDGYIEITNIISSLVSSDGLKINDVKISAYKKSDSEQVFPTTLLSSIIQVHPDFPADLQVSEKPLVITMGNEGKARLYLRDNVVEGDEVIVGVPFNAEIETFPLLPEITYERNLNDKIKLTSLTADVDESLPFYAASIKDKYILQKTRGKNLTDFYSGRIDVGLLSGFSINSKLFIKNIEGRPLNISGFNVRYE